MCGSQDGLSVVFLFFALFYPYNMIFNRFRSDDDVVTVGHDDTPVSLLDFFVRLWWWIAGKLRMRCKARRACVSIRIHLTRRQMPSFFCSIFSIVFAKRPMLSQCSWSVKIFALPILWRLNLFWAMEMRLLPLHRFAAGSHNKSELRQISFSPSLFHWPTASRKVVSHLAGSVLLGSPWPPCLETCSLLLLHEG